MYFSTIITLIIALKKALFDLIAPPLCAYCKELLSARSIVCDTCTQRITPLVSVVVPVTKKYHMPVLCIGEYKDPLKKLILSKGWSDYVASHELGHLMYYLTPIAQMSFDVIVPIPLHWTRFARRGYNQAEEMARTLANYMDIPCVNAIKRVRATPLQSSVAHTQRGKNVKSVFEFVSKERSIFRGKRILLVDDLMTTGATLQSAAKAIATAHPDSLSALVAARVK